MTALTSPVYTLGMGTAAEWQANALDPAGCAWICETEDGWSSSPPARPTQQDKTLGDGTWAGTGYYAGRLITLTGTCVAPDQIAMLNAKDAIKAAVGPWSPVTLQVDELTGLSRIAQVRLSDKIELQDKGNIAFTWQMGLFAPDPRRYQNFAVQLATGLPPGTTTGRTYPRTYPDIYGGAGLTASGSVVFYQIGDYPTAPAVITIYGPVINPTIQHTQSGKQLMFALTLAYNQFLVVDLGAQTALVGGTANVVNTVTASSAWMMMMPGANEFRFRGQAGLSPAGLNVQPSMVVVASSAWV